MKMNNPGKIETIDEFEEIMTIVDNQADDPRDDKERFKLYKDAFYEVTQGKFELVNCEEMLELIKEGASCGQSQIKESQDIEAARQLISKTLKSIEADEQAVKRILLCTTEAATNIIKHAKEGNVEIKILSGLVRIIVNDSGPGIEMDELPHSVFLKGYSTSSSLGFGFSIMYRYTDKIHMATAVDGTFLILNFNI